MDLNHRVGSPLWENGNVISEGSIVDLVDENGWEGSSLVVGTRLELGVGLDDGGGGDCRERTNLCSWLEQAHENTGWNSHRSYKAARRCPWSASRPVSSCTLIFATLWLDASEIACSVLVSHDPVPRPHPPSLSFKNLAVIES